MSRMFLVLADPKRGVHGVDYTKGLEDGRTCGRSHEFYTRECRPVYVSEEDLSHYYEDQIVEIVPLRVLSERKEEEQS